MSTAEDPSMEDHLIVNGQDQLSLARCITRVFEPNDCITN